MDGDVCLPVVEKTDITFGSSTLPNPKKNRAKVSRAFTSLPSSPVKRKFPRYNSDEGVSFSPFNVLPVENDDQILWWKVPLLKLEDLYDWQLRVHPVDGFAFDLIGVIKTSPSFEKISDNSRQEILKFLNAPREVFDSIGEHFEDEHRGRKKHKNFIILLNAMEIGLFRYGKTVYALLNVCPHQKAPLALGDIEECNNRPCINCPRHHWKFDLATGRLCEPRRADGPSATVFSVKIINGEISVGFNNYHPKIFQDVDF